MQICVHTDDKKYSELPAESNEFSRSLTAEITHATLRNEDALGGRVWQDTETIYWKQESQYKFLTQKQQTNLVKLAFLEASMETPLVIRQRRRSTADAQIKVNWLGKAEEDYFVGKEGVLAFGYGPGRGVGGDITMNADRLWLLRNKPLTMIEAFEKGYIDDYNRSFPNNTLKYFDPLHTMKHEGGHAVGMKHLTDRDERIAAVMFPFYNGLRKFGTADKEYLHELYGAASVNHKIKEIILSRIQFF